MDSSKTIEDDTIRDEMESGYVATRPRFTRARRTWKLNVRNLLAEDVRAIDAFAMGAAARGGNKFLFPNLLSNGSFELPATLSTELVSGWSIAATAAQAAISASSASVEDGSLALAFTTTASTLAASATATASVVCSPAIACKPGEVYAFAGSVKAVQGNLSSGVLGTAVVATFYSSEGGTVTTQSSSVALASGWQQFGCQFTVPSGAVSLSIRLTTTLTNATSAAITLDSSASITWDAVGCALLTPLTGYGRMVGSQPLGCFVRFSKLPEISDIGFGGGVKRYGASIELTEV